MPEGKPKKQTNRTTQPSETVYDSPKKTKKESETTTFRDVFKLDESYTSLLLGMIVVIVAAVLFVSLFKNQHFFKPKLRQDIATQQIGPTISPTTIVTPTAVMTQTPTVEPTALPTASKTTPMPTARITSVPKPTPKTNQPKTYVVKAGDDLWAIATQVYNNGYKWTDIAKANNLVNPDSIDVGMTLVLPQISQMDTNNTHISNEQNNGSIMPTTPPTVHTYTVIHGDTLWSISIKLYGDGYQWTKIATANNLTNPQIINAGNILKIP